MAAGRMGQVGVALRELGHVLGAHRGAHSRRGHGHDHPGRRLPQAHDRRGGEGLSPEPVGAAVGRGRACADACVRADPLFRLVSSVSYASARGAARGSRGCGTVRWPWSISQGRAVRRIVSSGGSVSPSPRRCFWSIRPPLRSSSSAFLQTPPYPRLMAYLLAPIIAPLVTAFDDSGCKTLRF